MAGEVAQPLDVDGADLFDEHPCCVAFHFNLRAERSRPSTSGRRSDNDDRARKQLVGLNDNPEAIAMLFMTTALWDFEPVNITAEHASTP